MSEIQGAPAPEKILKLQEAAAIYAAMCLVGAFGFRVELASGEYNVTVFTWADGVVYVSKLNEESEREALEVYQTSVDFAAAYGVRV